MDVAVIGSVFTDIKGFSINQYDPLGRNPGRVDVSQGGVGRNVAENLANLGLSVDFVSSVDQGMLGNGVLSRLEEIGVDTTHVVKAPVRGMGIWMLINDKNGEQVGSLSQLPDGSYVEKTLDSAGDGIIARAEHVVLETDVSLETAKKTLALVARHGKKLYALPATMGVVLQMPELLAYCECFICNDIEAGRLFQTPTADLSPADMLAVLKAGMERLQISSMVVTMGARGAVYADGRSQISGYIPAQTVDVVDCSGAGDAFFSGSVAALIRGLPLDRAVQCGTRLAALTIQSTSCTCEAQLICRAQILPPSET